MAASYCLDRHHMRNFFNSCRTTEIQTMKEAAAALEDSWQIAVDLASEKLSAAQLVTVSESANRIAQSISGNEQRYIDDLYRAAFISEAARVLNDPVFGLTLSRNTDPRKFGAVFYATSTSASAFEALENLQRYCRLMKSPIRWELEAGASQINLAASGPVLFSEIGAPIFEWGTANIVSALRYLTDNRVNPDKISFAHHRSEAVDEFEAFFKCEVLFGQSRRVLAFPSPLDCPIKSSDPYLLSIMRKVCEETLSKRRNSAQSPLCEKIEKLLIEFLPQGKATADAVARELAMSPRTLSRRLTEDGTSFSELLENLRRALAMRYLHDRHLELMQIAWLLGYSEVSSFNHAFKRWTSATPGEVRESLHTSDQI